VTSAEGGIDWSSAASGAVSRTDASAMLAPPADEPSIDAPPPAPPAAPVLGPLPSLESSPPQAKRPAEIIIKANQKASGRRMGAG
jgi:hypothetical protein